MSCGGTNSTQTSLLGDCNIPDIGCVLITDGAPNTTPEQDQLPFAYDPVTGSLWLYQCDNGPWTEIPHTTLCDLATVDITTIVDVCNSLQIPITYGDCELGRVTMQSFAQQIKDCLDLRRICELDPLTPIQVGNATSVELAACVDGESNLIPYDPFSVCKLFPLTDNEVYAASNVGIAACINGGTGDQGLIRPETIPCLLDSIDQTAVDAATSVELAACVDGEGKLIPLPETFVICDLSILNQAAVDAAATVTVAACVDGVDVLIPYIPEADPFQICSLGTLSQGQVDVALSVTVAACVDGVDVLIPYIPESTPFSLCSLFPLADSQVYAATNVGIAACINGGTGDQGLIRPETIPCLLDSLNQTQVDGATSVELVACVDGEGKLIPYGPTYEPVVIKGLGGRTGKCYVINPTNNPAAKLFDSRFGLYEGPPPAGMPVEFSFTNPTNQPGIVRIHGSFWIIRYETSVGNYARTPANLMFMLGLKTSTDTYDFDELAVAPAASHPRDDDDVSYDSRLLPTEPLYKFFGNWFSAVAPSADLSMEASADIDHEFEIAAGQTLTFAAMTAVGYQNAIDTAGGDIERSWLGFNIHYTFEGHNRIS